MERSLEGNERGPENGDFGGWRLLALGEQCGMNLLIPLVLGEPDPTRLNLTTSVLKKASSAPFDTRARPNVNPVL